MPNIQILKDTVQDCNINFLIGSGMSAPYLSTLWNIETLLTELHNDSTLENNQKRYIRASIYKKFFADVIDKNIAILEDATSAKPVVSSYKNFFEIINKIILKRKNNLLTKQVNLFTTNIDICLEKALELNGFELNDGFNGRFNPRFDISNFRKSIYKSSLHYENNYEIPVFNVLKIHGSLTWKFNDSDKNVYLDNVLSIVRTIKQYYCADIGLDVGNDDTFATLVTKLPSPVDNSQLEQFISEYENLSIINPTKDKFRDTVINQTYYDLLRVYANELEKENTVLFVMGFSFADEHIKELTLRVANSNPTLMIYIFAYTPEAKNEIEHNINMSKLRNNNIMIYSPEVTRDCDGNDKKDSNDKYICEYKYSFDQINERVFNVLLKSVGE